MSILIPKAEGDNLRRVVGKGHIGGSCKLTIFEDRRMGLSMFVYLL